MTVVHDGSAFRSYTGGWVTLPNSTVNDERLSFRARGVLAYLVGRPPGWRFSAERIAKCSPSEGREAILTALRELEQLGYVRRSRLRGSDGRVQTITEAAATPELMPPPEAAQPTPVEPDPAEPGPVDPTPKSQTDGATTERAVRTEETGGAVQRATTEQRAPVDNRPCSTHHGEVMPCRRCALDRQLEQAPTRPTPEPTADVRTRAAEARAALRRPTARQAALLSRLVTGGPGLFRGVDTDRLVARGWVSYEGDGDVVLLTDAGRELLPVDA